jgi:hypothetical protein
VTLVPLPEGLTPDVVEKLRWEAFGHRRASSLGSANDQARFVTERGFVLVFPVPGLQFPSVLEATVGRPLLDFAWDERVRAMAVRHAETLRSRKVGHTAVLAGRSTAISPHYLARFFALAELEGEGSDCHQLRQRGVVDRDVMCVTQALARQGPLDREQLSEACSMHQPAARRRFDAALGNASRCLLVVEVDARQDEAGLGVPVYDLLPRAFPRVVEKSRTLKPAVAREQIVCRYLRNVLVDAGHEVARVLGWPETVVLDTCDSLVRKGHVQRHPASRPNRHLFQATSTDLLQDPPEASSAT